MKKNDLLKVFLISFISIVFLSWIIPIGQYENGAFTSGNITPIGIFDLGLIPLTVFDIALPIIIFIMVVGGFYGVLNKTGVYSKLVDSIVKKYKDKKIMFLTITIVILSILSSLVGLNIGFFIIIPFISAILLSMGYSKFTTMIGTFTPVLIGSLSSIYGADVSYYFNGLFGYQTDYTMNSSLFPDGIILLILTTFILIMFARNLAKKDLKNSKKTIEEIALYEKENSSKKNYKLLLALIIFTFVFILIGTFKWDAVIGGDKTPMLDFYKKVMDIKLGGFNIISGLLGTIPAFGYFELPFVSVFVLIMTFVIAIVYKIKSSKFIEGFMNGLQENLRLVIYVIGANLVSACLFKNGATSNFANSIVNFLMSLSNSFNSILLSITTVISSIFFNSYSTLSSTLYVPTRILTGSNVHVISLVSLIFKSMYGLVMMIAPTSVLLVTGLAYYKISYKEWIKNTWKFLLELFVVIVLIIIIVTIFAF